MCEGGGVTKTKQHQGQGQTKPNLSEHQNNNPLWKTVATGEGRRTKAKWEETLKKKRKKMTTPEHTILFFYIYKEF